jgi:hypothetical protein
MPTAAKLICAFAMAAVGYLSSEIVVLQTLEEGVRVGWFQEYNALLGFFFGWRLLGRMVGEAISISMMNGLFVGGLLMALALVSQGFYTMITESLDLSYDSPEKALNGMLNFTASYAAQIFDSVVLGFHFGLSVMAGLIGHFTARNWR